LRRLLIRPGAIGDTILALPALEFLRAGYTEVWVRSEAAPLVRFADRVRAIASTGIDLLGIPDVAVPPNLIEALRGFDSIVSWYGENRPEFRDAVAALGLPFRFLPALPRDAAGMHAADWLLHQAGGSGTAIPRIGVAGEPRNAAVIHPLSGSTRKNWPMERFVTLAGRLPIEAEWASRENWLRFADLRELAGWMAGAALYVGNDSGITHLAAALGVPVVALFGPTNPAVWGPRGADVRIVRGRAMDEIEVDAVLAAALELL
jgi:lipopolysaccharide heptosyltransferase III